MMAPYTTNLVTNPSFEVDLTGYTAIGFTTLTQNPATAQFGQFSMQVVTDGSSAGQGFSTPQIQSGPGTYSFSFYANAASPVNVRIVVATNPGGTVIVSPTVTLAQGWARYKVEGLAAPAGTTAVYANVVTLSASSVTFNVDGVQLEPSATTTDYCDGDQYGCVWTGDPNASTSTRDVRFALIADGNARSTGGSLKAYSPQIPVQLAASSVAQSSTSLTVITGYPSAVFDNFAMYRLADPDPAVTYCVASNAGTYDGGYGQPWTRHWMLAVPPANATYAAVGMRYGSVASGDWHYLHAIQLAVYPINSQVTIGPTTYVTPRQILTTVKPTRLNFAKNPGFSSSTNYWSVLAGATLSRDTTTAKFGTTSGKVLISTNNAYAQHDIDNLIAGRTYTVSAYLKVDSGVQQVFVGASSYPSSVTYSSFATPLPSDGWVRVSFSYTASSSRDHIRFTGSLASGHANGNFWVDGILIEENASLLPYFDGSYGFDYLWEAGGVAGESRSYWYQGRRFKQYLVGQVVAQNNPMGITSAAPVYAVPYTQ